MKLDLELELEKLKDKYKELYKKKPSSRAKYIWRYDKDYKRWYNFLSQFKDEKILDFGSGAGIALRAGLDNDLNITGLDIYSPNVYEDMRNVLKVSPNETLNIDGILIIDIRNNTDEFSEIIKYFNKYQIINEYEKHKRYIFYK